MGMNIYIRVTLGRARVWQGWDKDLEYLPTKQWTFRSWRGFGSGR